MDDLHRRIANRIRETAERRRIPLSHLADRAGVSRRMLWQVLGGDSSPTVEWLQKVAAALDVEVIDLLRDEPPAMPWRRGTDSG